ncbi:MAG: type II toxin-antitoxin system RelE/ParE family toxin [Gemmataceae bacterium]|nr:type II toxin-antitoxin system RelE/ParE family toxin [Gemmataceae bacterium]
MSLPIVINPIAGEDLDEAQGYYESRRAGLGDDSVERVNETLARISYAPELYAVVHKDLRQAPVHRFPCSVIYRADAAQVAVVAIHHTSRDPRSWLSRA